MDENTNNFWAGEKQIVNSKKLKSQFWKRERLRERAVLHNPGEAREKTATAIAEGEREG